MRKFVSFISPMYNVNKYLPDLLESFVNLPKDQYELILVDDLGSERPEEIIGNFENKVNIKYIRNHKNLGLGFARNEGLKNISKNATHFMFIDSDDILDEGAGDQILETKSDITLSSSFIMFTKSKRKRNKIGKNSFYKGAGVSPAGGHLISVKYRDIQFTSQFFEDQRYMAKLTLHNNVGGFGNPVIKYRNRRSSILNENNNSKRKAVHISQFVDELTKSKDDNLIMPSKSFGFALLFAKVEFLYISKRKRKSIKIEGKYYTKAIKIIAALLAFFEKLVGFGWFFNAFKRGDYFE